MSNFNIALLKTLNKVLSVNLKGIHQQLNDLLESKIDVNSFTSVPEALKVVSGLSMIQAWGEHDFAKTLATLLQVIKKDEISNDNLYYQAIKVSRNATKALMDHLNSLSEKDAEEAKNVSYVELWPIWSEMSKILGEKEVSVNRIFTPYANFNDVTFRKVDPVDLENVADEVKARFEIESNRWIKTESKDDAIVALRKMIDDIDSLYRLKHVASYQKYFLALKGRLVLALRDPNAELDNKSDLAEILNKANFEIRNFGKSDDKHSVEIEDLKKVMLRLLSEKAQELSLKDNTIAEVYQRFDIPRFLSDVKKVMSAENQEKMEIFSQNIVDVKRAVHGLKEALVSNMSSDGDKRDLLAAIKVLLVKKEIFPQNKSANSFLNTLYVLFNKYRQSPTKEKINPILGKEVATLIIMLDKYIEKKGYVSEAFEKQVELQAKKVELAISEKYDELSELPVFKWDDETQKNLNKEARLATITEIRKDFEQIESILDDIFRGEDAKVEDIEKIEAPARMAIGALTIIKEGAAVNVLSAIRKISAGIAEKGTISDEEREAITVGVSGLSLFFNSLEKDDKDAVVMLIPAVKLLFNKDLVVQKDIPEFNFNVEKEGDAIEDSVDIHEIVEQSQPEPEPEFVIEDEKQEKEDPELLSLDGLFEPRKAQKGPEEILLPVFDEEKKDSSDIEDVSVAEETTHFESDTQEVDEEHPEISVEEVSEDAEPSSETMSDDSEEIDEERPVVEEGKPVLTEEQQAVQPQTITFDKHDPDCYFLDYLDEIESEEEESDIKYDFYRTLEEIRDNPEDRDLMTAMRRVFHTLKGSGKQVGLWPLAYLAQDIEYRFNQILGMYKPWTPELESLAVKAMESYVSWARDLKATGETYFDPKEIQELLEQEEFSREMFDQDDEGLEDDLSMFEMPSMEPEPVQEVAVRSGITPESTSLSDLPSFIDEEEKDESESPLFAQNDDEADKLHEEMEDDERNVIPVSENDIDVVDPLEAGDHIEPEDYLPVLDDLVDEESEESTEAVIQMDDLFVRVDTVIDSLRESAYEMEDRLKVSPDFVGSLEEVKKIASEVNYKGLEDIANKLLIKCHDIEDIELTYEEVKNILVVKEVIVDALTKVIENDSLLDINDDVYKVVDEVLQAYGKEETPEPEDDVNPFEDQLFLEEDPEDSAVVINFEESNEEQEGKQEQEEVEFPEPVALPEPEMFDREYTEENNDGDDVEENGVEVVEENKVSDNVVSDVDKEKQLDIILSSLINMRDNLDLMREAFSKLYK